MRTFGFVVNLASTFALRVVEHALVDEPAKNQGFKGLRTYEGRSVLGKHNGVMDKDLRRLLKQRETA